MNPDSDLSWQPSLANKQKTAMWRFMEKINQQYSQSFDNYFSLHQWSVENPSEFWENIWDFCEVKSSATHTCVLDHPSSHARMQGAKWFTGSRLNFAENLLKYCHIHPADKPAIIFRGENRVKSEVSYASLYQQVASIAEALKKFGIVPGDRVVGYLPNMPEAIIAMLATTSLGAIWSSCSPDFGFNGVMDRFSQIRPKVIFSADGYYFKDKAIECLDTVKKLSDNIDSLNTIVIVSYLGTLTASAEKLTNAHFFNDLLSHNQKKTIEFAQLPFDHPLYIMYSSGTTGTPKCIVHGAGGTLLQHLKELVLHTDLGPSDRLFYFTTCGWMMWNWLVSGLATGASLVLYDGSPFYPKENVLIDLIDDTKISVFGTSAKYLSALEKTGAIPRLSHKLSTLRCILSTGSPLAAESFDYVYRDIKQDVQLSSITGGTDILSCFALGSPISPIYRGELQCRGLGMDVDVYNDQGEAVEKQKGELVCKSAFPSMPLYFWNDKNNQKYHDAYFNRFPNIWAHGDYAEITHHNGLIIHGRSDTVLNPGGVRIGTAEIYRQVEKLPEIMDSVVVGQTWKDDVRIILFVKLTQENNKERLLDESLKNKIRLSVRENTTPRHVPELIIQVEDIPRTISGKIVELAVRKVIHGEEVKNIDALANPEALDHFRNLPELNSDSKTS